MNVVRQNLKNPKIVYGSLKLLMQRYTTRLIFTEESLKGTPHPSAYGCHLPLKGKAGFKAVISHVIYR